VHNVEGKPAQSEAQGVGWATNMTQRLGCRRKFWGGDENRM